MQIHIIATGKMANSPFAEAFEHYQKQLRTPLTIHEINAKSPHAEHQQFAKLIPADSYKIFLDENGKNLRSQDIAARLEQWQNQSKSHICFVIGGADGHAPDLKQQADEVWAFGNQTWPHLMARMMLVEQLFRAQSILSGHPYHRA